MNTLQAIADSLVAGSQGKSDVALAQQTGLARQSIGRALSGQHNFSVLTLLAIAEANGQQVLLVPRDAARAITGPRQAPAQSVSTMVGDLKHL